MDFHEYGELGHALFEESGDALFLLDPESDEIRDVNSVASALTGFSRAELLQLSTTHLFRVEQSGGLHRLRGAFVKTMVFHGEDGFLLRTKEEAAWIPVNLTVSRLHVSPKPLALIVARDDRERRSALSQTRRMEAELRAVLASAPAAIWSAERSPGPNVLAGWQFRYVSPRLASIAARPVEFFDHPLRWAEAVHLNDRERYRAVIRKLLTSTEQDANQVYRVSTPEGSVRWVSDRLQVARDSSGRPIRLDGCITDVTDQREAEEAARQSEFRFRAVVEKGGEGIVLLDEKAGVLYASPSVRTLSGYDPMSVLGRDGFGFVTPEDESSARQLFRRALHRPGEDLSWCGRAYKADGSIQLIELNACNRLDDPSVRAVVLNYRDVTERVRLEEALRQAAKMEAIGRLAGGIAHDFNNLLTVVLGNLELLQAGNDDPRLSDELLTSAESAARQAADLTRQMLGFARRQPLQTVIVDVNALVQEEIVLLRRSMDPRIAIRFTPADELMPVLADPVQLQQILLNLCLNARDAMPDGGTLTIQTENAGVPAAAHTDGPSSEGYIRLLIADTGLGMPAEVRAKVFEPFFTTKEVGRGTGLGLAVVYGVARAHHGWVECHSAMGHGSRFDVYLPYAPAGSRPAAEPVVLQPDEEGRGETVLLADDEPSLRTLAETGLARYGYRVIVVDDGEEAVKAFQSDIDGVAVVVLDLMMPKRTGREAFEAIRELNRHVPVLFASGYSAAEQLPSPLPSATAYLPKPYTPRQLALAIRQLLDANPFHIGDGI